MKIEEIETVRAFNQQYFDEHFSKALHYNMRARSAALHLKARGVSSSGRRLMTPAWAIDKANTFGAAVINTVRLLDVCVLGDLDSLVVPATEVLEGRTVSEVAGVSPEVAARMAMGVLRASGRARGRRGDGKRRVGPTLSEPQELLRLGSVEVRGVLIRWIWSGAIEIIAGLFERHEPLRRWAS